MTERNVSAREARLWLAYIAVGLAAVSFIFLVTAAAPGPFQHEWRRGFWALLIAYAAADLSDRLMAKARPS